MWGYLSAAAGIAEAPEEPKEEFEDKTDYDSVMKAQVAQQGVTLQPLAELYQKDDNKEDQIANFMQQYTVLLEFQRLLDCLPSGMYLAPSYNSVLIWHGTLFVRSGMYRGGVFKFQLDLGDEYPEYPPSLKFLTDIYHPMVEPETGIVDLEVWFPEWRPGSDYAACSLPRLHKMFAQKEYFTGGSDAIDPMHPEARELFQIAPEAFAEKVKACVAASNRDEACFQNPEGALLRFAEGPAEIHDNLLEALRSTNVDRVTEDDRKCMFVEWFCDHYVRHQILNAGKKKKKKKNRLIDQDKLRDRRPVGGDLASIKKFAESLDTDEEDEDDDSEDDYEYEEDESAVFAKTKRSSLLESKDDKDE